jgi:hypothetical protein
MVKSRECLAYEHLGWRFEWYVNRGGKSPAAEYYHERLGEDEKDELTALFEFLAECNGQLRNKEKIRSEGEKLFAFKPKPHRFMAFFVKAKAYRRDYEQRTAGGIYYDEDT